MPSSYLNDLRIELQADGENASTWGQKLNDALTQIGDALAYGTQDCFATDANATTTVADGAADPARAMYFKVTSTATLTATRTLTIAPNTISRVMFIENATTGSQSITISQGSGSTVTIATGKTAVVYLDGAGATAAVVDAMAKVDPGVTDTLAEVLVAGNATGGTDIAVGTGDDITFADSSKAIFGAGSDLQIYHNGTHSFLSDQGTGNMLVLADNFEVNNSANNENKIVATTNGAVTLYYDNAAKIATTSTGIDVTGTVTADGLTVDGGTKFSGSVDESSSGGLSLKTGLIDASISNSTDAFVGVHNSGGLGSLAGDLLLVPRSSTGVANSIQLFSGQTTPKLRQKIADNGDISFYEDTGTTPKFFWDASAEALGIGTSSPTYKLNVLAAAGAQNIFQAGQSGISNGLSITSDGTNLTYSFLTGNVGIGITSPTQSLDTTGKIRIRDGGNTTIPSIQMGASGVDGLSLPDTNTVAFITNSSERMRIDSSGNLLVGTTTTNIATEGTVIYGAGNEGVMQLSSTNMTALYVNRSNDGELVQFRRGGGTTVGSIGTVAGRLFIGNDDVFLTFQGASDRIYPASSSGGGRDNAIDLGEGGTRFKDLYLSGGAYLGGTGAANKLDDYEEGTFTATLRGGSSEPGTLITAVGRYTKIGELVSIRIGFENKDTTGYSGGMSVEGCPFTNSSNVRAMLSVGHYQDTTWNSGEIPVAQLGISATTIIFQNTISGSVWTGNTHNAGTARYLWITGSYET